MTKIIKNGFTLVELLVTIILLGVIGSIIIYNMASISSSSKETEYERFIATVKSAASVYVDTNPDIFNELYVSKSYIYITIEELVTNGLLDEDLENPYTNEKIGLDELIKASLDSSSGVVTYEYPLESTTNEMTLVAISDYVVWGENYDCMRGAGSYELALSDEDGDLIDLSDEETIEKYNFKCSFPSSFTTTTESGKTLGSTKQAGNYEITYSWITESGIKKQAVRILKVLGEVNPTFKTNVNDYDFKIDDMENPVICSNCDSDNYYQTSLNSNGEWNNLTYDVLLDGVDSATTEYKISKINSSKFDLNNADSLDWVSVTDGYVTTFSNKVADDGDNIYRIEVKVSGHYDNAYEYVATGYANFKSELIIPTSYITTSDDSNWDISKEYYIESDQTGYQSPVGISSYEYRFSDEDTLSKDESINEEYVFDIDSSNETTTKSISFLNLTACVDEIKEYEYIYFRAINKDGYAGKWTKVSTKITNSLANIIDTNSKNCTDSTTCCLISGDSCYFTEKVKYISFSNQLFALLEKYDNGEVLVALDGDTGTLVSPLTLMTDGYAEIETAAGLFYKYYDYYVANDNIITAVTNWADTNITSTTHVVTPAISGTSNTVYTLNQEIFNKYQNALSNTNNLWLLDNNQESFIVYLDEPRKHSNESTTAYNAYFYYTDGTSIYKQYGGQSEYVKPIMRLKDLVICSGTGTSDDPYVVHE